MNRKPWRDHGNDPVGLANRQDPLARVGRRDDSCLEPLHVLAGVTKKLCRESDLAECLDVGLSLLERKQARELLASALDRIRHPVAKPAAVEDRDSCEPLRSPPGRGDRCARILCARLGQGAQQLSGGGARAFERLVRAGGFRLHR